MKSSPPTTDKPSADLLEDRHRDTAIQRVYDVALEPERYEALLDFWEEAFGPLRAQSSSQTPLLNDPLILEHFRRADAFLDRTMDATPEARLAQILEHYQHVAAFVFDANMSVLAATPGAQSCLSLTQGAQLSAMAIDPEDIDAVIRSARRMLADAPQGIPSAAANAVLRVRSRSKAHLVVLHLQRCDAQRQPPMVLAVSTETFWPKEFPSVLQHAFDLTSAEADVVRGLVACCSIAELAQQRGRSIDTIRAQIKSIMSKTETHSQVELIRLIMSVMDMAKTTIDAEAPAIARVNDSDRSSPLRLAPSPPRTITVGDGRRVDYLVLGDVNGCPVLYLHLDYGLVRWPASMEARAAQRGLKIIVPIRAGYGQSSPLPRNQDYDDAVVSDALAVLNAEAAGPCPIISLGQDSAYGFRLIQQNPERFSALIACAGVLPTTRPEQFSRMEKWHRFILAGGKYTPHLLPFMVKSGFFLARKIGKRGFIHAVYGNCPADVETFEEPEIYEAMVAGSDVALSATHSAHDGFSRMILGMLSTDWSEDVHRARGLCPVIFYNGLQDPQVPAETLFEFQEEYDWIDFRVFEDAGQLIFFRKLPEILDTVENYLVKT